MITPILDPRKQKLARLITDQWLAFERTAEKLEQQILEKAKRINRVIPIAHLSKLDDVIPHDQPEERISETG